jgi:hypothetical protein
MVQGLWEVRLGKEGYQKLLKALATSVDIAKEENVFSTGEIEGV